MTTDYQIRAIILIGTIMLLAIWGGDASYQLMVALAGDPPAAGE